MELKLISNMTVLPVCYRALPDYRGPVLSQFYNPEYTQTISFDVDMSGYLIAILGAADPLSCGFSVEPWLLTSDAGTR